MSKFEGQTNTKTNLSNNNTKSQHAKLNYVHKIRFLQKKSPSAFQVMYSSEVSLM